MPRFKLILPKQTPWTKIPNSLIDELLPSLRDTELRLLLVLLRESVGWNRPDRVVHLTYAQLKRKTGRASEALAFAISELKSRELIHTLPRKPGRIPKTHARFPNNTHSKDKENKEQQEALAFPPEP